MTLVKIGLETLEGRHVAWALEHPGCYAFGADAPSAIVAMGRAIPEYVEWLARHTSQSWFQPDGIDIRLVDTWQTYHINDAYEKAEKGLEINALFAYDWKPLSEVDVERGLLLLEWTRDELIRMVTALDSAILDSGWEGERWSIRGILAHLATAEWWFLSRFGEEGVERSALPKDPMSRMLLVRERLRQVLPTWMDKDLVIGKDGELWSPRKVLRRAVWHERDHIGHITRLLQESNFQPGG
jgi:hypothetical protein